LRKYGQNAIVAGVLLLLTLLPALADQSVGFQFVPAHTRIGLARVTLLVSDLTYSGSNLTGNYEVRIPLAPWMNDRGKMLLDLGEPLDRMLSSGKSVTGRSRSVENGRVHPVNCSFEADGTIQITIETEKRTLAFTTRLANAS
jgi:hypothetical protein